MPDRPLVSVLMTAYNREEYIAQAIESVLASTFEDFELIIVDDGSADRTLEIARRYLSDERVRVHVNPKNLGDYPNRNRAAELAQGSYLKYVDADDVIYPHGLAVMVNSMERFPEAGFGLCRLVADKQFPYPFQTSPQEAYHEHFLKSGLLSNAPLSAIIRTSKFRAVGGFSAKRYVGDVELWLKMAACFPVVKMVPGLTWWRSHGNQEYWLGQQQFAYPPLMYQVCFEALTSQHCPLTPAEGELALRKLKHGYARQILATAAQGHVLQSLHWYRAASLSLFDLLRGARRAKTVGLPTVSVR